MSLICTLGLGVDQLTECYLPITVTADAEEEDVEITVEDEFDVVVTLKCEDAP